jgi:hypothetical protein
MFPLPSGRIVDLPVANDFSGKIVPPAVLELDGPRVTRDDFGLVQVDGVPVVAPSTTKGWQSLPLRLHRRTNGAAVLLIDDSGSRPIVRILTVGDGATSDLIDFTDELAPTVASHALHFARGDHPGALVLPTGSVLVVDGDQRVPLPPEIFDMKAWTVAGPLPTFVRGHHGEAVLLPDGRVLASSDGLTQGDDGPRVLDQTMEVFTPGYLTGVRPAIASAPETGSARSLITVMVGCIPSPPNACTLDVSRIASASLTRLTSVTHGTDSGQRYVRLQVTRSGDGLRIRLPSLDSAPSGDYLLHIVDDRGIPSPARVLRLR